MVYGTSENTRKVVMARIITRCIRDASAISPYADTPVRRHANTPTRRYAHTPTRSEAGVSVVELSIVLLLFTTVAIFGLQTIQSGWMLQNSAIMQSMTDAYAGIETANAQRWTFAGPNGIVLSGRWPVYPASTTTNVTIGKTPKGPLNATVIRTSRQYTDALTGAQSYLLESYVVYKDEVRQYCKLSKVYRTQ